MNIPDKILTRLLKGEHFNVEERKEMGLWPPESLQYDDVVNHLAKVLEKSEWFPVELSMAENGSVLREGISIHRKAEQVFVCFAQRTFADDPTMLAEKGETVFDSSHEAADYYLRWELNLPGRLDGWPVV